MPTTAPAISTNTKTLVIPFFRSAFSPKKWPALNRNPIKKITPRIMGKIARMVSDTSLTEFSIPPICANMELETASNRTDKYIDFFIRPKI
tara:strand:- start:115 stop:387 length:273 start_codon:yes stop_codon:yes gene_type:complete